mgnify:FL=1
MYDLEHLKTIKESGKEPDLVKGSMNIQMRVSEYGGKTFQSSQKHMVKNMNVIEEHNPSMSTTYINNRVSNSPIDFQDFKQMSSEQQQMIAA